MSKQNCLNCRHYDSITQSEHHQPNTTWCVNPILLERGAAKWESPVTQIESSLSWQTDCNRGEYWEKKNGTKN